MICKVRLVKVLRISESVHSWPLLPFETTSTTPGINYSPQPGVHGQTTPSTELHTSVFKQNRAHNWMSMNGYDFHELPFVKLLHLATLILAYPVQFWPGENRSRPCVFSVMGEDNRAISWSHRRIRGGVWQTIEQRLRYIPVELRRGVHVAENNGRGGH